jgi:hypothetical protein
MTLVPQGGLFPVGLRRSKERPVDQIPQIPSETCSCSRSFFGTSQSKMTRPISMECPDVGPTVPLNWRRTFTVWSKSGPDNNSCLCSFSQNSHFVVIRHLMVRLMSPTGTWITHHVWSIRAFVRWTDASAPLPSHPLSKGGRTENFIRLQVLRLQVLRLQVLRLHVKSNRESACRLRNHEWSEIRHFKTWSLKTWSLKT